MNRTLKRAFMLGLFLMVAVVLVMVLTATHAKGETYTQTVGSGGGFDQYRGAHQDFGWTHSFPDWDAGYNIQSVQVRIRAYDVDAEPHHGAYGEYDRVTADGQTLTPEWLQGYNGRWETTTFDVPVNLLTDNGVLNMWVDIDVVRRGWYTRIDWSQLIVEYTTGGPTNDPPYQPTLSIAPSGAVGDNSNLVVTVTGPSPADPNGDAVTYSYRWFVNVGTGAYLDPGFAGRSDPGNSNTCPASYTHVGDRWRVQVTPQDSHGAIGPLAQADWSPVRRVAGWRSTDFPSYFKAKYSSSCFQPAL